ncbi:MAG: hypothetical protein QW512_02140 [Thermofilaceae archaeon]
MLVLALLISSMHVHASDPVSVAYSILQEIEESRTRVEPVLINVDAYVHAGEYVYSGYTRFTYYSTYGGGLMYISVNASGVYYTVDGLPLVSFSYVFNASVTGTYYTVFTMSNEYEQNRYMYFRLQVNPITIYGLSFIWLTWGVKAYNGTQWVDEAVVSYSLSARINETYTLRAAVVPCFYEYSGDLIFGFAVQLVLEESRRVVVAVGDVAYSFLPLANRTTVELADVLLRLYRWRVFIGAGVGLILAGTMYRDVVYTRSLYDEITFNYTVISPAVFAVRVNAEKLMELYASGLLPVYDPHAGFLVSEKEDPLMLMQRTGTLMMGLVPLGISLVLGYFMRKFRVSSTVVGLVVVAVSSILMYTLFSNPGFIVLLLISSLMIVSLRWGEA